jgi:hypothetical protein
MTDGQMLIATWKCICKAVGCANKKTAQSKCHELGVKIFRIRGVPNISAHQLKEKIAAIAEKV